MCVACIEDNDCGRGDAGPYCDALACVECRANDDCNGDAGMCVAGRCQEGSCEEREDDGEEEDEHEEP